MSKKGDHTHVKPTGAPQPTEVERDRADPALGGFVPKTLRLPYTRRPDVGGRTVEELAGMIRDSRDAFDRGDKAPSVESHADTETGGDVSDVSLLSDMAEGTMVIMGLDDGNYPGFIVTGSTQPPEPTSPGGGPDRKCEQFSDPRLSDVEHNPDECVGGGRATTETRRSRTPAEQRLLDALAQVTPWWLPRPTLRA